MVTALDLATDALAVFRLTRLATRDTITQPARGRLTKWATEVVVVGEDAFEEPVKRQRHPKLAVLIECPWCQGWWFAVAAVAARALAPRAWRPVSRALALSAAAGLLAGWDRT